MPVYSIQLADIVLAPWLRLGVAVLRPAAVGWVRGSGHSLDTDLSSFQPPHLCVRALRAAISHAHCCHTGADDVCTWPRLCAGSHEPTESYKGSGMDAN